MTTTNANMIPSPLQPPPSMTGPPSQSGLSSKNLTPGILDVADAKVARLKGGSGEVVQGDAVPLVATAYFQYKGTLSATTWGNLPVTPGETLFYIDDSGEVRSHKLPIDQDVVTSFLDANYDFDFSIKTAMGRPLSGVPDSILQTTSRKWVRVLDTAGVQSDLLEIDIRVEPASSVRLDVGKPKDLLERVAESQARLETAFATLPDELTAAQQAALTSFEGQITPAVQGLVTTIQTWIDNTVVPSLKKYIDDTLAGAAKPLVEKADEMPARTAEALMQQLAPKSDATNALLQELLALVHEFEWASIREVLESVRHELTHKKRGATTP